MPFNTEIPNRAIKPTPAEMLNGIFLKYKAKIPPTAENGTNVIIIKDILTDLNAKYSNNKINNNAIGSNNNNLLD